MPKPSTHESTLLFVTGYQNMYSVHSIEHSPLLPIHYTFQPARNHHRPVPGPGQAHGSQTELLTIAPLMTVCLPYHFTLSPAWFPWRQIADKIPRLPDSIEQYMQLHRPITSPSRILIRLDRMQRHIWRPDRPLMQPQQIWQFRYLTLPF